MPSPRTLAFGLAATILLPLALGACSDDGGSDEAKVVEIFDASKIVNAAAVWDIADNQFKLRAEVLDNRVKIRPGQAVVWVSEGNAAHTVTHVPNDADGDFDVLFDSGSMQLGKAFVRTFDREGIFEFECRNHPAEMSGRIVVEADTKG